MSKVYLGLVHYPIYNKNNEVITTALTNFDLHDIARTARTYGIAVYWLIHPIESQLSLARDMMSYWQEGPGSTYNPDRKEAFSIVKSAASIENVIDLIREETGQSPYVVTTDARTFPNTVSYAQLRNKISQDEQPCLILFGTGWGIEKNMMSSFDYILEPIYGPSDYNHLPVRSAVAIILDRLLGEHWWK